MAKRAQQNSGEGRVTAKSRPMMNFDPRGCLRFVSSSASSNPGRTSYGYPRILNNLFLTDRAGQPVETSRSDYLQKDYGLSWSSCRSIMHYTSYFTNKRPAPNNGYVMNMLEHNTMINIDTGVHMISHNTQI